MIKRFIFKHWDTPNSRLVARVYKQNSLGFKITEYTSPIFMKDEKDCKGKMRRTEQLFIGNIIAKEINVITGGETKW